MKFIEVHMPESDFDLLSNSMDVSSWFVMGVYDKEISEQIKFHYQQMKILKQNDRKRSPDRDHN